MRQSKEIIFITALKSIVTILFVSATLMVDAQESDSIRKVFESITYTRGESKEQFQIDTSLRDIQLYDPIERGGFKYKNMGYLGTAHVPFVSKTNESFGFDLGYNNFDQYRMTNENLPFYNTPRVPYTHLYFLVGLRKEQTFLVTHSQNIKKYFNFGFHYYRISTEGDYTNQKTRHNDIGLTTRYDAKGGKYQLKTILIFNNVKAQENGGVQDSAFFDNEIPVSKELIDVELLDAENIRNDIKFTTKQEWRLGRKSTFTEDSVTVTRFFPTFTFNHNFSVGREKYAYSDFQPDSAYYLDFFPKNDSLKTSFANRTKRVGFYTSGGFKKQFIQSMNEDTATYANVVFSASARYSYFSLTQNDLLNEPFHQLDVNAKAESHPLTKSRLRYNFSLWYSFFDYTQNDMKLDGLLNVDMGKVGELEAAAGFSRKQPSYIFSMFAYDGLSWTNNFNKIETFHIEGKYALPKFKFSFSARFQNVKNLAYWDENRLPQQTDEHIQVLALEMKKDFMIKHFGFDNIFRINLISNKALIRLPVYWSRHTFYFEKMIFKGALLTKLGVDVWYNTNYAAPGYFPLTGQAYLQNIQQLKFYPVLGFFISIRVKTVQIFFRIKHLSQGIFASGYFNAYKYPSQDRLFSLGFSWRFYN